LAGGAAIGWAADDEEQMQRIDGGNISTCPSSDEFISEKGDSAVMREGRRRSRWARRGRDDGRWLVRAPTLKKHSPNAKTQDTAHRTSYSAVAESHMIAHRKKDAQSFASARGY
jgi:hypothetical protein